MPLLTQLFGARKLAERAEPTAPAAWTEPPAPTAPTTPAASQEPPTIVHKVLATLVDDEGTTITLRSEPVDTYPEPTFAAHAYHGSAIDVLGVWRFDFSEGSRRVFTFWEYNGNVSFRSYDMLSFRWTESAIAALEREVQRRQAQNPDLNPLKPPPANSPHYVAGMLADDDGTFITLRTEPVDTGAVPTFLAHAYRGDVPEAQGAWRVDVIDGAIRVLIVWRCHGEESYRSYDKFSFRWSERYLDSVLRAGRPQQ